MDNTISCVRINDFVAVATEDAEPSPDVAVQPGKIVTVAIVSLSLARRADRAYERANGNHRTLRPDPFR